MVGWGAEAGLGNVAPAWFVERAADGRLTTASRGFFVMGYEGIFLEARVIGQWWLDITKDRDVRESGFGYEPL